jgi:glycosyltransferase involved in cell wall biosynthesis
MSGESKIGLILSGMLGNRTICNRLLEALRRVAAPQLTPPIWLSTEDYLQYRAPVLLRRFSTLETTHVIRRMLASIESYDPSVIFVNGYELAIAAQQRFPHARLAVALDATPALIRRLHGLTREPKLRRLVKYPLTHMQHEQFRRFARQVWQWLPISRYCNESLLRDYAIAPEACHVMRAPQKQIAHRHEPLCADGGRLRLLFAGNDFLRKGGIRLLEVVSGRLAQRCNLTIASNDPVLDSLPMPANVTLLRGITDAEQMSTVYGNHDLLVLPTSYDVYPNVLCESLAQATPFLASSLPGIQEIIDESGAGWALPRDATPEQIASAIEAVIAAPEQLAQGRERALAYARQYLHPGLLDRKLREMLQAA